jgi:glucokinase
MTDQLTPGRGANAPLAAGVVRQVKPGGPCIGVDIGGSKVLAVLLGPSGEIEASARLATPVDGDARDVVEAVLTVSERVAGRGDEALALPLGVGIPGMVDRGGVAHFCPHLHGIDGVDIRQEITRRRAPGATTVVLNDATAACWGEHRAGAGRGFDDVLLITLGTGIGAGAIVGGKLLEGAHGFAGEMGHMVVDPHGPACPCGKRGCWERFASGSGLGRLAREAAQAGTLDGVVAAAGGDPEAVRGEHVTAAAVRGDPEALAVMNEFAWWLALGLANLANALDPQVIVLGGGLIEAADVVMAPVCRAFADLAEAPEARGVEVVAAALGERAGAVGAALIGGERAVVAQRSGTTAVARTPQ